MNYPTQSPKLTLITAVLNGADTLNRCIDSISAQNYPNIEYIVMDGGSTDGTVDILRRRSSDVTIWETSQDLGIYDAWNKALRCATGEWVMFLGADDFLWSPRVLTDVAPHLIAAEKKEIRLLYGRVALIAEDGAILGFKGKPWDAVRCHFQWEMCIPHPGLFHRRDLFSTFGMFDIRYRVVGDYEFLLRVFKTETAVFIEDIVTVGFGKGGVSHRPSMMPEILAEIRLARNTHGSRAPFHERFSTTYTKILATDFLVRTVGVNQTVRISGWIKKLRKAGRMLRDLFP